MKKILILSLLISHLICICSAQNLSPLWTGFVNQVPLSTSYSQDGSKVATGGNIEMKVWNANTGGQIWADPGGVHAPVVFSPDGMKIAVGNLFYVKVYDANSGVQLWSGYHSSIVSIAYSPNNSLIATGGTNDSIKVWNALTGALIWSGTHSGTVGSLCFSPNNNFVVSGGYNPDNSLKIWNANTGGLAWSGTHSYSVKAVCFSHDGTLIASVGNSDSIKLWNANTGTLIWSKQGGGNFVKFNPDDSKVFSDYNGITARNTGTGIIAWTNPAQEHCLDVSETGNLVASGGTLTFNDVGVWDANAGILLDTGLHNDWVYTIAFSHDGTKVFSGSQDNTVKMWGTGLNGIQNDILNSEFSISPNPATDKITIEIHNGVTPAQIIISDVTGRIISQLKPTQSITQLDIKNFPAGIYFVQFKTKQGVEVKKFVKE